MWPLIIPPIVLVVSLGFLVWYLSRKSADPLLRELMTPGEAESSKRFWFIFPRDWGLRILERLLQRLKLLSLKFHNRFQEFANFLRRKREAAQGTGNTPEAVSLESEDKDHFWDRWHRRHRATLPPTGGSEAVAIAKPTLAGDEAVPVSSVSAPTPSRFGELKKRVGALARPEGGEYFARRKREVMTPAKKLLSEEELIDRIAKNPKDAASYEELGDHYLAGENLEDAKACYRQVIKLSPLNREVKDKVRKLERMLIQRDRPKR